MKNQIADKLLHSINIVFEHFLANFTAGVTITAITRSF